MLLKFSPALIMFKTKEPTRTSLRVHVGRFQQRPGGQTESEGELGNKSWCEAMQRLPDPLRQAASIQHGGPHALTPAASSWGRRARFCVSVFRDNQATVEKWSGSWGSDVGTGVWTWKARNKWRSWFSPDGLFSFLSSFVLQKQTCWWNSFRWMNSSMKPGVKNKQWTAESATVERLKQEVSALIGIQMKWPGCKQLSACRGRRAREWCCCSQHYTTSWIQPKHSLLYFTAFSSKQPHLKAHQIRIHSRTESSDVF